MLCRYMYTVEPLLKKQQQQKCPDKNLPFEDHFFLKQSRCISVPVEKPALSEDPA